MVTVPLTSFQMHLESRAASWNNSYGKSQVPQSSLFISLAASGWLSPGGQGTFCTMKPWKCYRIERSWVGVSIPGVPVKTCSHVHVLGKPSHDVMAIACRGAQEASGEGHCISTACMTWSWEKHQTPCTRPAWSLPETAAGTSRTQKTGPCKDQWQLLGSSHLHCDLRFTG